MGMDGEQRSPGEYANKVLFEGNKVLVVRLKSVRSDHGRAHEDV